MLCFLARNILTRRHSSLPFSPLALAWPFLPPVGGWRFPIRAPGRRGGRSALVAAMRYPFALLNGHGFPELKPGGLSVTFPPLCKVFKRRSRYSPRGRHRIGLR